MNGGDFFDDAQMLAPPRTVRVAFDDGSFVLRSPEPLQPYARCIGEWLEHWARATPDAPAFAERTPEGWLAPPELGRDARAGRPHRAEPARAEAGAAGADRRAVRQRARPPAADAGRHAHRPRRVHRLQRLLPADQGLQQDPRHPQHARPGFGLCRGRRGLRPGHRQRRAASASRCSAMAPKASPARWPSTACCAAPRARPCVRPSRPSARHARQVPADLGLHRPPEGGDQHAPHAVRQPADDRAGLALPRSTRSRCWWTGCRGATPSAATTT